MTMCGRLLLIQNTVSKLPDSAQKSVLAEEIEKFMFYIEGHETGDKALSDEMASMCTRCRALTEENLNLKLELREARAR